MKSPFLFILIVNMIFFSTPNFTFSAQGMGDNYYILSNSGSLKTYVFTKDNIIKETNSFCADNNVFWPCFDNKSGVLYFESTDNFQNHASYICKVKIDVEKKIYRLIKIAKGRFPTLSPNSSLLAYYVYPNQLVVTNTTTMETGTITNDMPNVKTATWISDNLLLYMNNDKELLIIDITNRIKSHTGYSEIIPGSTISSDGEKVICGSYNGKQIFLYYVKTNNLKLLKKTAIFSIGTSFVWAEDWNSFFYTRQTWLNLLRLRTAKHLFNYSFNGEEVYFPKTMALFGGTIIPKTKNQGKFIFEKIIRPLIEDKREIRDGEIRQNQAPRVKVVPPPINSE